MNLSYNNSYLNGSGQAVCVIDTGIDTTHEALQNKITNEYCYCAVNDLGSGGCCPDNTTEDNSAEDDNGHGTHISGIIASINETYKGIAPGVKIVAVKVLDSTGSGLTSDVVSGIDYCIDNKDIYNITVMTLSLGGGRFYDYCDDDTLAEAANKAANNGIFVAAASGNEEYNDSIATPACASNVTSVGSVTKQDAISSFTNTDEILDTLAPGSSITSTQNGGGYTTLSGTSMAAPHVAAAAALLLQYKKLYENSSFSPQEIEDILKNTGVNITDSRNGLNFSRIDIFAALNSLDNDSPRIILNYPTPENNNFTRDNFVFINISINENINSIFLEWNGTNESLNNYDNFNFYKNKTNLEKGLYSYKIIANDSFGNIKETDLRNVTTNNSAPIILFFEPNSSNATVDENKTIIFNISVSDNENDNLNFSWYLNGTLKNTTQNYTYEPDFLSSGFYKVNVSVEDSHLKTTHSWNLTVVEVSWNSPVLNQISNITVNESELVNINESGEVNATDADNDSLTFTYSSPLNSSGLWLTTYQDSGNYTVNVTVTDGRYNDSQLVNIEVLEVEDIDNDGINDSLDTLIGSSSFPTYEGFSNIEIYVNESNNLSQNFTNIQNVSFKNNITNETLVFFLFNFSEKTLNLTNISIINQSNETFGAIIIKNLVLSEGKTKGVYLDDKNESIEHICIKDDIINSINEISISCNSTNEFLVRCNSSLTNNYNCTDQGQRYFISGLNHSGVREHICQESWSCTAWSSCVNSIQARTCVDNNNCGTELNKPALTQSCSMNTGNTGGGSRTVKKCIESWNCSSWSLCNNGTQTRTCIDLNECGTYENKSDENRSCKVVKHFDKSNKSKNQSNETGEINKTIEIPGEIQEKEKINLKQRIENIISKISLANYKYLLPFFGVLIIVILISLFEKRLYKIEER